MTPVQASTIPLFLKNKDVVVEAVTGWCTLRDFSYLESTPESQSISQEEKGPSVSKPDP